jgi:hypothetical protein
MNFGVFTPRYISLLIKRTNIDVHIAVDYLSWTTRLK